MCGQIVLQDSAGDDSYAEVGVQDQSEGGEPQREDFQGGILGDNNPRAEHEFLNGFPQYYNGRKRDLAGKRLQVMNAPASIPGGSETLPFRREEPQISRPFGGKFGSSYGERYGRVLDMSIELYNANLYVAFFTMLNSLLFPSFLLDKHP